MAVLHEHELHYRCAFELIASRPGENIWGEVVRLIRSWISDRIPPDQKNAALGAAWFYRGGEWKAPGVPRLFIKTETCVGKGSEVSPEYWALRYEHPDSEVTTRQWRTDIGVTATDATRLAFSLSTIHWLLPGFLGQEPPDPLPTAPRIVSNLLGHKSWEARAGSEKLEAIPFLLRDGSAAVLLKHLEDPDRACPLVLVAKDFDTSAPLLDPRKLARLLAGTAVVWESESSWVDKELEQLLGKRFSCWNGMVRVYQPRVDITSVADAKRHRYFDKREIESLGFDKVEGLLVRGVVRRSRVLMVSRVMTVEDVQSKQAEIRFAERQKKAERGSQEWVELLEYEVQRLTNELKEKDKKLKDKDEEISLCRELAEDSNDQLARLRYEHQQAIARASEAESVRSALSAQAALLQNLEEFPGSMLDVIELVEKMYPDRIFFTEKARKSAKEATLKNLNIAWKCLKAMATILHNFHFREKLPFREIIQRFRASSGFELAVGESETTRKHRRLSALRKDVYKGESIDISAHVKHGTSPGNTLRVHYSAHARDRLLVVGHCGDHLDTVRTN